MTWFRVDDGLPSHPKVLALPRGARRLSAMGAWTLAGAWCSKHPAQLGVVPDVVLSELGVASRTATDLVDVGLWLRVDDGYRFHDFHDYNPTAEEVAALREKRAQAGRRGGLASGRARSNTGSNERSNSEASASSKTNPVPARPDPTTEQPPTEVVATRKRAANATRIPDNWPAPEDAERMRDWASENCPAVDPKTETANWHDWHLAKGDTAKDWNASWRTWMRRAQKDAEHRRPAINGRLGASTTDERVAQTLALKNRLAAVPRHHQPELGAG